MKFYRLPYCQMIVISKKLKMLKTSELAKIGEGKVRDLWRRQIFYTYKILFGTELWAPVPT